MPVTWLDAPDSALASSTDTIDFIATSNVLAISVHLPGRFEERAYRDGKFLAPYTHSTRNGNVFALRRTGGWPSDPTVYVDETPTNGMSWGLVESVDLTGGESQELISGAYTIAGRTWWAKGVRTSGYTTAAGPTGMVLTTGLNAGQAFPTGQELFGQTLFCPFNQLANYNPAAPTCVVCKFSYPPEVGTLLIGLISTAENASSPTLTERAAEVWAGYAGSDPEGGIEGTGAGQPIDINGSMPRGNSAPYGTVRWARGGGGSLFALMTVFPKLAVPFVIAQADYPADPSLAIARYHMVVGTVAARTNPGLGVRWRAQTGLVGSATFESFRIYQPRYSP